MAVNEVSTSSGIDAFVEEYTSSTTTANMLSQEEFLQLFVAQLEYQDPLNPMEITDMSSQLCQFSQLATEYSSNELLQEISDQLDGLSTNNAVNYLGKEITLSAGGVTVTDEEVYGGSYTLEEAASVEIVIYDFDGEEIARVDAGQKAEGTYDVEWDGENASGDSVENGTYLFEVEAIGSDDEVVSSTSQFSGVVTGIAYEDGYPYFMVNDMPVDPALVISVNEPKETEE